MLSFLLTSPTNSRAMREIERTLKRASSGPLTRYNKKIKNHLLEVQRLLGTLNALRLPPDESLGAVERDLMLDRPHSATLTFASEEGMSSSPPHLTFRGIPTPPSFPLSTTTP